MIIIEKKKTLIFGNRMEIHEAFFFDESAKEEGRPHLLPTPTPHPLPPAPLHPPTHPPPPPFSLIRHLHIE